jgi:hypothetical protein
MVAEWVAALAASGAGALVGAAATDAWQTARAGVLTLFGRTGERRRELAAGWLDEDAAALFRADGAEREVLRQRLLASWQTRLADLLDEHPEAADELRAWAALVREQLPNQQQTWVQQVTAHTGGAAYGVMGGNQYIHPTPDNTR